MAEYYRDDDVTLHLGDSLAVLPTLADASVDSIVTDPPYGLTELAAATVLSAISAWMAGDRTHVPDGRGFMGREWDRFVPPPGVWDECLRVLKPGGHLLAFAGSRTVDLMTLSIRIAGFEIRDSIDWIYGSGFPKSLDVSKAIDKAAGAERKAIGPPRGIGGRQPENHASLPGHEVYSSKWGNRWAASETAPATDDAARWEGWGTALKPAHEPIVLARKPLAGTVAGNVLQHGTGAINIDGCRTAAQAGDYAHPGNDNRAHTTTAYSHFEGEGRQAPPHEAGRWPTNVLLTHPPLLDDYGQPVGDACADGCAPGCPIAEMDAQSGVLKSGVLAPHHKAKASSNNSMSGGNYEGRIKSTFGGDEGGASRFFPVFRYEAKAPASERPRLADGTAHTTVKPLELMRWLVRLVTPPGGTVLDPFAGSGTTLEACVIEGFHAVGIELGPEHAALCKARLSKAIAPVLFGDLDTT